MKEQKFESETATLKEFFQTNCSGNKHPSLELHKLTCKHQEYIFEMEVTLCLECRKLLEYSLLRLENCPYEIKPKCRQCTSSCYAKKEWKQVAKVMRYSGLRLGVLRVKKQIKEFFVVTNVQ